MRIIDGFWQNNTNNQYSKNISEIETEYESQKFAALQASALVRLKFKKYFDVVIFQILSLGPTYCWGYPGPPGWGWSGSGEESDLPGGAEDAGTWQHNSQDTACGEARSMRNNIQGKYLKTQQNRW